MLTRTIAIRRAGDRLNRQVPSLTPYSIPGI